MPRVKSKGGMRNKPKEITLLRQKTAWELRQKMWTQSRIAQHLGISQVSVSALLNKTYDEFCKRHVNLVDRIKFEQIAQLEAICDEAMQAWEKSKLDGVVSRERIQKKIGGKEGQGVVEKTTERREQYGDPRLLAVILKAKEDIRRITGAEGLMLKLGEPNARTLDEALERFSANPGEAFQTYKKLMNRQE